MALIAIVGKPNTGKSTLFNRIAGKRKAVESKIPGTTRDRIFFDYQGDKLEMTFVDTGGISFGDADFENEIKKQAEIAIADADIILFSIDSKEGCTVADQEVAQILRKKVDKNKIFLVATKADKPLLEEEKIEFLSLGFDEENTFFVSAFHNVGIKKLLNKIEKNLLKRGFTPPEKKEKTTEATLALIGKPNTGKSSLVNAFLNEEKLIVSNIPGTTIDSVDFNIAFENKNYTIIDTAGIRKRKKIKKGIESFSILRSFEALKRADIALLVIDATEGATHQEQAIINEVLQSKTGLIIVVNKWDQKEGGKFATEEDKEEARKRMLAQLRHKFAFISWASVVFVSAKERKNLTRIFLLADEIQKERQKKIPTPVLNQFLEEIMSRYSLKGRGRGGKRVSNIKFCKQVGVSPPHFVFFLNNPEAIHFSSKRYIENRLRETFGFVGTPVVLEFKQK